MDVVSSFVVFSYFNYMFLSMYCLFESMKIFFSSKKEKGKKEFYNTISSLGEALKSNTELC